MGRKRGVYWLHSNIQAFLPTVQSEHCNLIVVQEHFQKRLIALQILFLYVVLLFTSTTKILLPTCDHRHPEDLCRPTTIMAFLVLDAPNIAAPDYLLGGKLFRA